jgi:hypothetical protein
MIRNFLLTKAQAIMASRPPDFSIGPKGDRYMLRWWVIPRNRWFNIYLHRFLHDDEDRALHDHPWVSCSYILWGSWRQCWTGSKRKRYPMRSVGCIAKDALG